MHPDPFPVIPAKAGIHEHRRARVGGRLRSWTPAFAGVTKHLRLAAMALLCLVATPASAERIKDLGNFAGLRTNQLVGYGIVVGLNGTGDDNLEYTIQSMKSAIARFGVVIPTHVKASHKNPPTVLQPAHHPPFDKQD